MPVATSHGRLGLTTPWARQYLPAVQRPEVEARIPVGTALGVSAIRRPGHWVIWLVDEATQETLWKVRVRDSQLQRACLTALTYGPPSLVWCSSCDERSVIEVNGEAFCVRHEPKEAAA